MKRFLRVIYGSEVYKVLEECDEAVKAWREVVTEFREQTGITSGIVSMKNSLKITNLSTVDINKIKGQLKLNGVEFKPSSHTCKIYVNLFKEKGLEGKKLSMHISDYRIKFTKEPIINHFKARDMWYVSVKSDGDFELLEENNYIEIEESEYYQRMDMVDVNSPRLEKYYGIIGKQGVFRVIKEHLVNLMEIANIKEVGKGYSRYIIVSGRWKSEESKQEYYNTLLSRKVALGSELYVEYEEVEVENTVEVVCKLADMYRVKIDNRIKMTEERKISINITGIDTESEGYKRFNKALEKLPGIKVIRLFVK